MNLTDVINYYLSYPVTSFFGEQRSTGTHRGVDLSLPGNQDLGKPIYSPISGVVLRTGYQSDGAGNYIVVGESFNDEKKNEIKFFHMKDPGLFKRGDNINVGDVVGFIGTTGQSTGPHLHIEVWEAGKPIDPLGWLRSQSSKLVNSLSLDGLSEEQIAKYALIGLALVFLFNSISSS